MTSDPASNPAAPSASGMNRRTLFKAGLLGAALTALPGTAAAAPRTGFTHGVASGEPSGTSVLLWTRYAWADPAQLKYEVSPAQDFATVVAGGEVEASPVRDGCVKPVVTGLEPDNWYYYRFIAPDGAVSDTGRTRTLPVGKSPRFRMAVVGCSNIGFGWFNAYAHIASADESDLVVHTGDYFYEYAFGTYPSTKQFEPGRVLEPLGEVIHLADYRTRFADYRNDSDLQRLHQMFPMVAIFDDHETANDSWNGGAENHDPVTEGSWDARKKAAMQAYHEWMPVSDEPWKAYEIGDLATMFRVETRITARSKQFDLAAVIKQGDGNPERILAALKGFHDGDYLDPSRTMMGPVQERWLADGLKASRSAGKAWQVLLQQVVMANLKTPPGIAAGLTDAVPAYVRQRIKSGALASEAGLPFNMDAWDGYPAARARLLQSAQEADANLVVLSGDSHNGWASELPSAGAPAGVEFAGHSVTSPGAEASLPWIKPQDFASEAVAENPQLKWANTGQRGYMALELTPQRATSEYRFLAGIRTRSTQLASSQRISTALGSQKLDIA